MVEFALVDPSKPARTRLYGKVSSRVGSSFAHVRVARNNHLEGLSDHRVLPVPASRDRLGLFNVDHAVREGQANDVDADHATDDDVDAPHGPVAWESNRRVILALKLVT